MACMHVRIGDTTAIVCTRGRGSRSKCMYCKQTCTKLCDAPMPGGKTCDRKLCDGHARRVGDDKDFCPDHALSYIPKDRIIEKPPNVLQFHTGIANAHRSNPDALDITIMTGGPAGRPFAPSMAIFTAYRRAVDTVKQKRLEAERIRADNPEHAAEIDAAATRISDETWAMYRVCYLAELLVSSDRQAPAGWESEVSAARARGVVPHVEAWAAELARPRRIYTCFCPTRERCHRGLFAAVLVRMGCLDLGEFVPDPTQMRLDLTNG